ncbi:MAG: DUF4328 domain-containing protein [Candidatus Saccharibacteria bacterium]
MNFTGLSRIAYISLILLAFNLCVDYASMAKNLTLLNTFLMMAPEQAALTSINDIALSLATIVRVLTGAAFLLWIYYSYKRIYKSGRTSTRFSPRSAVAWFFIPIANLYYPYIMINELYEASNPVEPWQATAPDIIVNSWWPMCCAYVISYGGVVYQLVQPVALADLIKNVQLSIAASGFHMVVVAVWITMLAMIENRIIELSKQKVEKVELAEAA